MRFLAGVGSRVNSQGRALDKALGAVLETAAIGSLIGMYPIVSAQIGFPVKDLDIETEEEK